MNDIKECSSEELIDKVVNFIGAENTKVTFWGGCVDFLNGKEFRLTLWLSNNHDSIPDDTTVVGFELASYVMGTRTFGSLWWKREVECVVDYSSVVINNLDNKYDFSKIQDYVDTYLEKKKEKEDGRENAERNEQVCKGLDILEKI